MKNPLSAILLLTSLYSSAQTDSCSYYFQKGLEEKSARKFLQSSAYFEKAIAFNPKHIESFLENADVNRQMRRLDIEKKMLVSALDLQPENKKVQSDLMQLYFNYRQFDKAIELAKRCNCELSDRVLGLSFYQQEDLTSTVKHLTSFLSKRDNDGEALYTLARTFIDLEEYRNALPWFQKAVVSTSVKPLWHYEIAMLYYTLYDYKNSVVSFENALKAGYLAANDFNENFGFALLYAGFYDRGEELITSVWRKKTASRDLLRSMAEILYQQKQWEKSLYYCQQLLQLDPKDAKALYQAGLVFQKKGEKDRGQQMCDAAIVMDPALENLRRKKEMPGM